MVALHKVNESFLRLSVVKITNQIRQLSFSVLKLHVKFGEFVKLFCYQYLSICNTSSN